MENKSITYTITPPRGFVNINLPELWRYRDLLYIFVWRDIKVRYKQTILGILWAIFQPFITMVIFSVFFGKLAKVPSDNIPYPVFVYSGLLLWNYYSTSLTNASNSLVENESIVKKIYFPRLILPLSATATPIIDFCFAFIILIGIMIYYHIYPNPLNLLLIPILLIISYISAAGLGLFLSAVNVKFRDVRYILPFFIQTLMFITPVIYPSSIVPQKYQWLINLNPMTGVISTARTALLQNGSINWQQLGISLLIGVIVLIFGITYFRKTERFFADIL